MFWIKSTGWLVVLFFVYVTAKKEWTWDFDTRIPKIRSLSQWWVNTGLPIALFMVIRWICLLLFVILYYSMTQRID